MNRSFQNLFFCKGGGGGGGRGVAQVHSNSKEYWGRLFY